MPPKKVEAVVTEVVPEQPPSFDNDAFVDELLGKAKRREALAVEADVAAALGKADDYKVNRRHSVVVDFTVECVLFASQHGFGARKTAAFVRWMHELRQSIETTGSVDQAKELFKAHLVAQAERASKDGGAGGAEGEIGPDGQPIAAAAPTPAPKPAAKKDKKKGSAAQADVDPNAVRPEQVALLSVADIGAVADFVVTGLLQHWRLYHYCATHDVLGTDKYQISMAIQTPQPALPLVRALTAEQNDAHEQNARKKAEDDLAQKRALEVQKLAEEEATRAKREEEERLAREEAEANELYFNHHGTEKVVANVHGDVQATVANRQETLLAKLAQIEELLHLQGTP